MKAPWPLALHLSLWALAFPAIGVAAARLERTVLPNLTMAWWPVPAAWTLMLCWAAWIYLAHVPRAPTPLQRLLWLAGYLATIGVVGYCALAVAVIVVTLVFGL